MTTIVDAPAVARPRAVQVAVAAVLTAVAVQLVDEIVRLVWRWVAGVPVAGHVAVFAVGIGWTLVTCGLGAFLAWRMRGGADWARLTLTVLAVLRLLATAAMLAVAAHVAAVGALTRPVVVAAAVVEVLLAAAALTFLLSAFRRSAEDYFAARPTRPAPPAGSAPDDQVRT